MSEISILHPFSPPAAGVDESTVATYHSQPHAKAMQIFAEAYPDTLVFIDYLTEKWGGYAFSHGRIGYRFFSVNRDLKGDFKKWKKQYSRGCMRTYKKNCPDVTIINMSGHSSPFSHQLAKLILAQGKPYVAMLGGQTYSDTPGNRWYFKHANHILVHTELQKQDMLTLPMFQGLDIRVFPLGVDCDVFTSQPILEKREPRLLYVGRIVEWKRVHMCVEALEGLIKSGYKSAHLDIIGPIFSQPYMDELQKMIVEKGLTSNVTYHGLKEHHELPAFFQQTDLFCLPSNRETFGMVMIEAMACGTPVAAIDCPGGPKQVITDGVNGILCTVEEYASRIVDYFKNKTLREQMAKNARQTAVQDYSLEATYKVLKQSVESCIKAK